MTNTAKSVLQKCGGPGAVADMLKLNYSCVYQWSWGSKHVPAQHQYPLLCAARRAGIDLTPADFFPPKIPPVKAVKRRDAR